MIGGRWAVVSLDRPQGATVERLTPFTWSPEADQELARRRQESPAPKLLGLAACAACGASDAGCEVCNPDGEAPIAAAWPAKAEPDAISSDTDRAVSAAAGRGLNSPTGTRKATRR